LLNYGTEDQKNHYLPRLADGREIPCFALTGPRAGSDATALPDTGVVCKQIVDGKEVVGIKMNFSKRYITLAPVATVVGLAFRMFDPEKLLGDVEDIGITVALLPRDTKGMDIGNRHKPIGSPFLTGPIFGTDVFIPLDYIIGGPDMRGKGWKMLVECLSVGRCITLPSSGAGGGKYAVANMGAYARIRRQFNVPVAKLEGVQEALARTAGNAYVAAAAARITALAVDEGEIPSVPSAILKYHLTEIARELAIDNMDVHGGRAVMTGPNNYAATGYSSVPVAITVEGANILTRSMIIFGQGAIRCHPYVLTEMQAAEENNLAKFDDALFSHFGFIFSNMSNSLLLSLSNGLLSSAPVSGPTAKYYKKVNRYSASFALMVDMAMFTLGGQLKFREITSARLGDLVSKMYLVTMVLKHWEDQGRQEEDLPLVEYACNKLFNEYEDALDKLLQNFPVRPLAWFLRAVTLPFGRTQNVPSDKLVSKLADLITSENGTRERLTAGIYRGDNGKNAVAKYDSLLKRVDRADPLYKAVQIAVKSGKFNADELTIEGRINEAAKMDLLSADDAAFMVEFEKDVLEMISVDHFEPDHFGPMSELQDK
jgi:acyl-CoA dehydrogenase